MKYIISLLILFVVYSSNAQNLPYKAMFWTDFHQVSFEERSKKIILHFKKEKL